MRRIFNSKLVLVGFFFLLGLTGDIWTAAVSQATTCFKLQFLLNNGMSLSEVEFLLGHGEKDSSPGTPDYENGGTIALVQGDECYRWCKDGVEIFVSFRNGKVCDIAWTLGI